jgi:hypothetical protein
VIYPPFGQRGSFERWGNGDPYVFFSTNSLHKKFPRFQDFLLQNAGESEVEEAIQNSNSDPEAMAASQLSRA